MDNKHYLSDLIYDFAESLEVEGGRSSKTAANYTHYLNRLNDFAGNISVDEITPELVRKYRLWLNRFTSWNWVTSFRY